MQNYILWWRKWQNEIRARTLVECYWRKILSPQRHNSLVIIVSTTNPTRSRRCPACTAGMAGIAGSLLTPSAGVGCGLFERRIVFQFTCSAERPSLFLGPTDIVFNKYGRLPPRVLGARCEVKTYFSPVKRLCKRGAMSPFPTCIRL